MDTCPLYLNTYDQIGGDVANILERNIPADLRKPRAGMQVIIVLENCFSFHPEQ